MGFFPILFLFLLVKVIKGGKTNFISSEIYTCTYRGRTPELKITKNKTWAWQGQKLHSKQKHSKL